MKKLAVAGALLAVLLLAGAASATKMLPLSLADLKAQAAVIAEVEAVASTVEQRDRLPFTLVECRVRRAFKGRPDESLTLRTPGGKRGELTMLVPGAPIPEKGDVFVAFLADDGCGAGRGRIYRSLGLGQGMFAVVEREGAAWAIQLMDQATKRFAACPDSAAACAARQGSLALPLAALVAELQKP